MKGKKKTVTLNLHDGMTLPSEDGMYLVMNSRGDITVAQFQHGEWSHVIKEGLINPTLIKYFFSLDNKNDN